MSKIKRSKIKRIEHNFDTVAAPPDSFGGFDVSWIVSNERLEFTIPEVPAKKLKKINQVRINGVAFFNYPKPT